MIKVLFIAGTGRSGTTILSNILGQVPGSFAGGEIRYAWQRGFVEDHRCGCGRPFSECPVWTAVVADAFGDRPGLNPGGVADRIDRRLRIRRIPPMLVRLLRRRPIVPPHSDDHDVLELYRALSRRPGVDVIVDSSKLPLYGMMLSALPGLEMSVVHVVRDPRATAFSWRRQKPTRDRDDETTMPQLELWRSAVLWVLWNRLTAAWLSRSTMRSVVVHYEDLVAEPEQTVNRITALLGHELPGNVIHGHTATLAATHSVAGNPSRHEAGKVELYLDTEWRQMMPAHQRVLVTILTLPGLRRFGYAVRSGTGTAER